MTLKDQIASWLKDYRRLAVLGIGNPLRGDDAVGIEILKALRRKVPENVKLFECEMVPENFLSELEMFKPSHVLMIDAAYFEAESGEARLIPPEKIPGTALSTHAMPLSLFAEILRGNLKAKVVLLGIQPEKVEFGEDLTPRLRKVSKEIAGIVRKALEETS